MRAYITVEVKVRVDVPDDLPEQVRQLALDQGENYVAADATDQEILERIALIRGVRGLPYDESMTPELNSQIRIQMLDESIVDTQVSE